MNIDKQHICRGKKVDTGEWVYGSYAFIENSHCILINSGVSFYKYKVIPETVGRYTGATVSENGLDVKAFEDDIVTYGKHNKYIFAWSIAHSAWRLSPIPAGLNSIPICNSYLYTRIGNVHDNPELMEEK